MTISTIDTSQRQAAKVVGLTYLFTMATAVFASYARGKLVVSTILQKPRETLRRTNNSFA